MTNIFQILLLLACVICAICVIVVKNNLTTVVIYMSFSSIMAVIWLLLQSPDLAITEAAVGAGVTSVLFFVTLKRIDQIDASLNTIAKPSAEKGEESHE